MGSTQSIFVNKLANSDLGDIQWPSVSNLVGHNITIKELLSLREIKLRQYDHTKLDYLGKMLVMALLISAEKVETIDFNTIKIYRKTNGQIPETEDFWEYSRYLVPTEDDEIFKEYDIISNLYPIVPKRLINNLKDYDTIQNSQAVIVHACGNCYNELFFQDARLVNPSIGIYSADKHLWKKRDSYIRAFDKMKSNFQCFDFEDYFPNRKISIPYFAYIAPTELTTRDIELVENIKDSEPQYYDGVINGWTLLVTNMDIDNIIIHPGKVDRNTMISYISDEFWDKYKDWTFKFLDGTLMTKPND